MTKDGVVSVDGSPLFGKTYDIALRGIECHRPAIALYFEFENKLKFYNLGASPLVAWHGLNAATPDDS